MAIPTTTRASMFEPVERKGFFFSSTPSNQSLPVSQKEPEKLQGLRKRLSSLSFNIQPISSSSPSSSSSSSWARRSKSIFDIGLHAGSSVRKWWDWGCSWILSSRPIFARDLELNEEETTLLGFQSKGTLRHVLYKVRSHFRRLLGSDHLPITQTFRDDSFSYAQNFDDAKPKRREREGYY